MSAFIRLGCIILHYQGIHVYIEHDQKQKLVVCMYTMLCYSTIQPASALTIRAHKPVALPSQLLPYAWIDVVFGLVSFRAASGSISAKNMKLVFTILVERSLIELTVKIRGRSFDRDVHCLR